MTTTITKSQLREHISKLVAEQIKYSKMKDHALLLKLADVKSLSTNKLSEIELHTLRGLIEDGMVEKVGKGLVGLTELGANAVSHLKARGHKPFSVQEHIAKLVAEQVKSLSPEAQKALELSRQAKLNKDAQKKRAAAKDSMRGISVEGVDSMLDEQSGKSGQYMVKFYDGGYASPLYDSKIRLDNIEDAIESAEEQYAGEAFEIWGPDGEYQSDAFRDMMGERGSLGEQSSWHRNQNGELADLYKTKYRVNFGQGQVSNTFPTRKEAEYEMTFIDEPNAFIQFKDLNTGEWFNIKHLREQRIEGDKRHSDEADFFDTSELEDYQDDLNNDYLGFDDDGDIGDSYQSTGESWDDGYVPGSYRYVREQHNKKEGETETAEQPIPYDDYIATEAEWDSLRDEQEFQARLDNEQERRNYLRYSGGHRRTGWGRR